MTTKIRSTRFLTSLSTVALCLMAAFGLFRVVAAAADLGAVTTHAAVRGPVTLPANVTPEQAFQGQMRVHDPSGLQRGLAAGRDLTPLLVAFAAVWLLRRVLRSVRDGDPFIPGNVLRLRTLGLVLIIGVPFATAISSLLDGEIAAKAGLDGAPTEIALAPILIGLALFVLAEVFAAGVRMRDDLQGTI